MKKLVVLLLLLLWPGCAARGETWTFDEFVRYGYTIETFQAEAPAEVLAALAGTAFAGDKVIGGAVLTQYDKKRDEDKGSRVLLTVEHQGAQVLVGGHRIGESWTLRPQSETFLREGGTCTFTAQVHNATMQLVIAYGQERYIVAGGQEARYFLLEYTNVDEAGNGVEINGSGTSGDYQLTQWQRGEIVFQGEYHTSVPAALETLDVDAFPRDRASMEAWAAEHPIVTGGTYIYGANLRKEATGSSKSLGVYDVAPAVVLDSKPGKTEPWWQVRVGDTVGWISDTYISDDTRVGYGGMQAAMQKIAVVSQETALRLSAAGETKQTLDAGTAMHILADCGEWYHVVIPRDAIGHHADAQGTYGYVRKDEVQVYESLLAMKYGIPTEAAP